MCGHGLNGFVAYVLVLVLVLVLCVWASGGGTGGEMDGWAMRSLMSWVWAYIHINKHTFMGMCRERPCIYLLRQPLVELLRRHARVLGDEPVCVYTCIYMYIG